MPIHHTQNIPTHLADDHLLVGVQPKRLCHGLEDRQRELHRHAPHPHPRLLLRRQRRHLVHVVVVVAMVSLCGACYGSGGID
jgi:hypothetical protein